MKEKAEGVLNIWERYKFAVLAVLLGIVLLIWPERREPDATPPAELPGDTLREELAQALGQISGVGQVRVVLTLESDGERQLAQDIETQCRGSASAPGDYQRSSEVVLTDGTGGSAPMIVRTLYPTYRGALIVCQGADRAEVKLAVTQAVQALTGLSSDRISVAKWQ